MANKGRPKSADKKQKIFAAAQELFMGQGFEGTSMDQVAERAGVSKQTIYSHFRNKEELFEATVSARCIEAELIPEAFADNDELPCDQMLVEVGHRFIRLLLSPEVIYIFRLTIGHAEQHPEIARLFYRAGPQQTVRVLADYLARQHQLGRLRVPEPELASHQLLNLFKGDIHLRSLLNIEPLPDPGEIDDYIHRCVALFLQTYGT